MVDGNVWVQCMMGDVVDGWCAVWVSGNQIHDIAPPPRAASRRLHKAYTRRAVERRWNRGRGRRARSMWGQWDRSPPGQGGRDSSDVKGHWGRPLWRGWLWHYRTLFWLRSFVMVLISLCGLSSDARVRVHRWVVFLDFALTVGSPFTVGVADEDRDTASRTEMVDAPERVHKMAAAPEPAPIRELTESAPEPAPIRELTESAPEPAPIRELTESAPEPASDPGAHRVRSRARSDPGAHRVRSSAAPIRELTESALLRLRSDPGAHRVRLSFVSAPIRELIESGSP